MTFWPSLGPGWFAQGPTPVIPFSFTATHYGLPGAPTRPYSSIEGCGNDVTLVSHAEAPTSQERHRLPQQLTVIDGGAELGWEQPL